MSDIYKVGIEIAMTGNAAAGLDMLGQKLLGVKGHVDDIGKKISGWPDLIKGAVAAFAGVEILKGVFDLSEHGMDLVHWQSQLLAAGQTAQDVADATAAAWKNAHDNMNTTAADSLKDIIELNKATGHLAESIQLLPTFSVAKTIMQSVKADGMDSVFKDQMQTLNLARGLEEIGVTQMGNTPEERQANIDRYVHDLMKTMVASRGLFDGNSFFNMTNNSAGAVQTWDERMATVIGPVIGNIMKGSKLGNADYMALKSFQGGKISSDTVEGLRKWGLAGDADTYQDDKGKWHLKANSGFAAGMEKNLWDWSAREIGQLVAKGINVNDPAVMNAMVNEIGGNKSNSALMRLLFNPLSRKQIQKEMDLIDQVPDDAVGILQKNDPSLVMGAFHDKWKDLLTALGAPMVGTATTAIAGLTTAISGLAQTAAAHPDAIKNIGVLTAALGGALTIFGGVKIGQGVMSMVTGGPLMGSATALNTSAALLSEAAVALGAKGVAGGVVGAAESAGVAGLLKKVPAWEFIVASAVDQYITGPIMDWLPHPTKTASGKAYDPEAELNLSIWDRLNRLWRGTDAPDIPSHPGMALGPDHRYHPVGYAPPPPPPPVTVVAPPPATMTGNVILNGNIVGQIEARIVGNAATTMPNRPPAPNTGVMAPAIDGTQGGW